MPTAHEIYTSDYVSSTQSVVSAARWLRNVLVEDQAAREYGITRLERAAQRYEEGGVGFRRFMFSELETPKGAETTSRERVAEDTLVSIVSDVQVANVLMAAGHVVGETGTKVDPRFLDQAILRLEQTTVVVERSLASPLDEGVQPGRFAFAEALAVAAISPSADVPSAIVNLRRQVDETLTRIVNEAQTVANTIVSALSNLSNLDKDKVKGALGSLGGGLESLPKIGRLFGQGIEKLRAAIDALMRLVGNDALAQIKAEIEKIWQDVKEGKYVADALKWAFGVDGAHKCVEDILALDGLNKDAMDQANHELAQLAISFKENMGMAQGLTSALAFGAMLLGLGAAHFPVLASVAGPAIAVAAAAYLAIIGFIVLTGRDYTDCGDILRRVRGVCQIASSVKPA